jgi:hypothetical protein
MLFMGRSKSEKKEEEKSSTKSEVVKEAAEHTIDVSGGSGAFDECGCRCV